MSIDFYSLISFTQLRYIEQNLTILSGVGIRASIYFDARILNKEPGEKIEPFNVLSFYLYKMSANGFSKFLKEIFYTYTQLHFSGRQPQGNKIRIKTISHLSILSSDQCDHL